MEEGIPSKDLVMLKDHKTITRRILCKYLIEALKARLDNDVMFPAMVCSFFDPMVAGLTLPSWTGLRNKPIVTSRYLKKIVDTVKAWSQSIEGSTAEASTLGVNTLCEPAAQVSAAVTAATDGI